MKRSRSSFYSLLILLPLSIVCAPSAHAGYTGTVSGTAAENGSISLSAPSGAVFTQVVFASYGTPTSATPYSTGSCNATTSTSVITTAFLNKTTGTVNADNTTFGDPCSGTGKRLSVTMGYTYYLTNSAVPAITGNLLLGETLNASQGTWANTPSSYSYQWQRATTSGGTYSDISGANSSSYVITSSDLNKFLRVTVTATNDAGSLAATSLATASAISGATTTTISISGSPTSVYYRNSTAVTIGVSAVGKVTVTANGKVIPGCKAVTASPPSVNCNWKPSFHGAVKLAATYAPTLAGYLASNSPTYQIQVFARTSKR